MATLHKEPLEILWERISQIPRLRLNSLIILGLFTLAGILYYTVDYMVIGEQILPLLFVGKLAGVVLAAVAIIWAPVNSILLIRDPKNSPVKNMIWIFISLIPLAYFVVTSLIAAW